MDVLNGLDPSALIPFIERITRLKGIEALNVFLHILKRSDRVTMRCVDTQTQLAAAIGVTRETVWRAITQLVEAGLLEKERIGRANVLHILVRGREQTKVNFGPRSGREAIASMAWRKNENSKEKQPKIIISGEGITKDIEGPRIHVM